MNTGIAWTAAAYLGIFSIFIKMVIFGIPQPVARFCPDEFNKVHDAVVLCCGMQNIPQPVLTWSPVRPTGIIFALGEIYFLLALLAVVLAIEFIGKDLDLRAAMIAFAHKRFQVPQRFKTGAMCRSSHFFSPFYPVYISLFVLPCLSIYMDYGCSMPPSPKTPYYLIPIGIGQSQVTDMQKFELVAIQLFPDGNELSHVTQSERPQLEVVLP